MDKKEINKRNKINFFASITRRKAKKEIAERQEKLGRPLSKEEKHAIVERKAEQARIKTYTWALLTAIGFGAFGAGYLALSDGQEVSEQHESGEASTPTDRDEFLSGIQVSNDEQEDEVNYTKEQEWIINEIDNLETKEDVLEWFKNFYLEEYERMTGDDTITTNDIQITKVNQSYVYILDNGDIVTHGFNPRATENKIKADGHSYTARDYEYSEKDRRGVNVFYVRLKENNEIIDAMTEVGQEKVISGDYYEEMKNNKNDSVLVKLGYITNITYKLMDDPNYQFTREELQEAVIKYYDEQAKEKWSSTK